MTPIMPETEACTTDAFVEETIRLNTIAAEAEARAQESEARRRLAARALSRVPAVLALALQLAEHHPDELERRIQAYLE